ncbi:serine protease PepA [Mycolicibacter sinensis]|uniref:Serine protease PepA n=2 Tax=Mycolicibacter sinensis (strain JDM601) TaxID=875328 RepID=F5Z2J3_MYCSD|nr:serine protease PepA [Mycolicibacter sinensis]
MSNHGHRLLRQLSDEIADLAQRVVRSTATVTGQTRELSEASGSAWLYDHEHLVTNNHVVGDLVDPIRVRFAGAPETQALVVGSDPLTDLAVLRVDRQNLEPLRLSAEPPQLGELCLAVGSPLGEFPESISFGIVSGLKRSIPTADGRSVYDVIQTDCAINPGNSGGPLVNVDGHVIGVNTMGIADADNINFAISADVVSDIVGELLAHGTIERATLGVGVALRQVAGLPSGEGLLVTAVRHNVAGPLERGDVLLRLGDRPLRNQHDLLRALRRDVANRKVELLVWRGGEELSLECLPRSRRKP